MDDASQYTTEGVRYALIADTIIRLDEIQTVVSSMDDTEKSPKSIVYFRNKERVTVEATREEIFKALSV